MSALFRILVLLALCAAPVLPGGPAPALADEEPPAATAQGPECRPLDEASLTGMMEALIKYSDDNQAAQGRILELLETYKNNKDAPEYKKLLFLFDTHQKVTTSLNNLIDILYITLKHGRCDDQELNDYIYSRCKNIITFLNNMVFFLTARNQEIDLGASVDVQRLYESYLVRLTTLLYELNKLQIHFYK